MLAWRRNRSYVILNVTEQCSSHIATNVSKSFPIGAHQEPDTRIFALHATVHYMAIAMVTHDTDLLSIV